ncbi:MAG: 4-hydroxyphenylacetate decarboxylase small subunit [Candidatus Cloacimonadales bacterium]|nr:4-hydroxyphenylacetate decarboxylase small subunit [Candidatus Cloacimonadales bacterium]
MNHIDCKYYLATDVFKGICKRTKAKIKADEPACSDFEKAPKCKHCLHFSMKENNLGLCLEKATAYPDMQAVTCNDFAWK